MISQIYNPGPWMSILSHGLPYVNPNTPSAGMLRYHNSQLQVYDGSSWLALSTTASVGLTGEANEILEWGRRKMQEERRLQERMERHPALQEAYDKFRVIDALTLEEKQNEVV